MLFALSCNNHRPLFVLSFAAKNNVVSRYTYRPAQLVRTSLYQHNPPTDGPSYSGTLVDRGLDRGPSISLDRLDCGLNGDVFRKPDTAAAIPAIRKIWNGVAVLIWRIQELAVSARINELAKDGRDRGESAGQEWKGTCKV